MWHSRERLLTLVDFALPGCHLAEATKESTQLIISIGRLHSLELGCSSISCELSLSLLFSKSTEPASSGPLSSIRLPFFLT
jgi:hypothetical protein